MGKQNKAIKVNPNEIKVRDFLMVALINGATKGGVYRDRKKDTNKYQARGKYRGEE